jgi:hypothetical protein
MLYKLCLSADQIAFPVIAVIGVGVIFQFAAGHLIPGGITAITVIVSALAGLHAAAEHLIPRIAIICMLVVYVLLQILVPIFSFLAAGKLAPLPGITAAAMLVAIRFLLAADEAAVLGIAAAVMVMFFYFRQPAHKSAAVVITRPAMGMHHIVGIAANNIVILVVTALVVTVYLQGTVQNRNTAAVSLSLLGKAIERPHDDDHRQT